MNDKKIKNIINLLNKAGVKPVEIAAELSDACIASKSSNITKAFNLEDNDYLFKVQGHLAQSLSLYVSEDDGQSWHFIDSWSDH
jgi:hypothetical protein